MKNVDLNFQTPVEVSKYMVSLIPEGVRKVLEPTPGIGNIVTELEASGYEVDAPHNYFDYKKDSIDCIVMNPPFSSKYAYGVPDHIKDSGMRLGYYILTECMKISNHIIALMPWFTLSDSDIRLRFLKQFGIKSITALPRKTFQYARIQTCIIELEKNYSGETVFKVFDEEIKNRSRSL